MAAVEPGWYPDPEFPDQVRAWDGTEWTDERAPYVATPGPPAASGSPVDPTRPTRPTVPTVSLPAPAPERPQLPPAPVAGVGPPARSPSTYVAPAPGASRAGRLTVGAVVVVLLAAGVGVYELHRHAGNQAPSATGTSTPRSTTRSNPRGPAPATSVPTMTPGPSTLPRTGEINNTGANLRPRVVGFGPVKIGMSQSALESSGTTTGPAQDNGTCLVYPIIPGGSALYSKALGRVVAIAFGGTMATSHGVKVGTPRAVVYRTYPGGSTGFEGLTVPLTPTAEYLIGFGSTGTGSSRVDLILMLEDDQDCGN